MSEDLLAALCLMLVLEGLFLFAGPEAWKRMAAQMLTLPAATLRKSGALMIAIGLLLLYLLRAP